jgi:hypothetical protein
MVKLTHLKMRRVFKVRLYPLPTLSQERASTLLATTIVSRISLNTANWV